MVARAKIGSERDDGIGQVGLRFSFALENETRARMVLLLYQPIEGHLTSQGSVPEWLLQFSGLGFSLSGVSPCKH